MGFAADHACCSDVLPCIGRDECTPHAEAQEAEDLVKRRRLERLEAWKLKQVSSQYFFAL